MISPVAGSAVSHCLTCEDVCWRARRSDRQGEGAKEGQLTGDLKRLPVRGIDVFAVNDPMLNK